ncbi:hypothetical protein BDW71DRAFT_177194 [Aspergillus fruticulosus]
MFHTGGWVGLADWLLAGRPRFHPSSILISPVRGEGVWSSHDRNALLYLLAISFLQVHRVVIGVIFHLGQLAGI